MKSKQHNLLLTIILSIICMFTLLGVSSCDNQSQQTNYTSISQLSGKKIGIITGSIYDKIAMEYIPDGICTYFGTATDLIYALKIGKVEAILLDQPTFSAFGNNAEGTHALSDTFGSEELGAIFPKTEQGVILKNQFNDFLVLANQNGLLEKIKNHSIDGYNNVVTPTDVSMLTGENGKLSFATDNMNPPFGYIVNEESVGFDVELAVEFCKMYGYDLWIDTPSLSAALSGVKNGKYDFALSAISITEDRAQEYLFSDPYLSVGRIIVVRDADYISGGKTIIDSFFDSVYKTFVVEARWQMILKGIGLTLVLTFVSAAIGTIFGFVFYLIGNNCKPFADFTVTLQQILSTIPILVVLMIFYYAIFGKSTLSGSVVSIMVFSLYFTFTMFAMLKDSIDAVPKGQMSAALSLGYTRHQGLIKVILPQASQIFYPNYISAICSLMRDTSIVGYISVQDITNMGDIIRSRTFDAFFPLILVAAIYFILSWILTFIMKKIIDNRRKSTKQRKNSLLSGVKL